MTAPSAEQDETYTLGLSDEEPEVVREWRIGQFRQLGFTTAASELLTDIRADWHQAARMLKAGCPVSLALEILI